jgi:hypothetical protein
MGKMERFSKFLSINGWELGNSLGDKRRMNETRQIALQRIHTLFRLAEEKIRE